MSFDVSTVQVDDTTEIVINHPATGEPFLVDVETEAGAVKRPMIVEIYGPGSRQYKAAQAASQKSFMATFHRGKSNETAEQKDAREAAFLSACTISFKNFTYKGLPTSGPDARETFRACYLDPKMGWLTEQVNGQMGDWASFTKAAPNG